MENTRLQKLTNHALNSSHIVALNAPPGFQKKQLLKYIAEYQQTVGEVLYFDRLDHIENPEAAITAIREAKPDTVIIIADAGSVDPAYLHLVLERHERNGCQSKVILSLESLDQLDMTPVISGENWSIIGPSALALDDDEVSMGLSQIAKKRDRDAIAKLAGRWPFAFNTMVAHNLRTKSMPHSELDTDLVLDSGLYQFVDQRILSNLSTEEQEALTRASSLTVPDRIFLQHFGHDNTILSVLCRRLAGLVERSGSSYLINPVLRISLLLKSMLTDPELHNSRLLEIADQCSSAGLLSDAARLASMAGAPERVRFYAETHGGIDIWLTCGFPMLKALVDNAAHETIEASPTMRMMKCIVDLKTAQVHKAQFELNAMANDPEIASIMKAELEVIRMTLLVYGCSLERNDDLEMLREMSGAGRSDPIWRGFIATLGCVLNSQRARLGIAEDYLREARFEAERADSRYNKMFLYVHETNIDLAKGQLARARGHIAEGRSIWLNEFPDDEEVATVFSAISASINYEYGRLTSARKALRKSALRLPGSEAWFDIYFAAYEPMARIYLRDHNIEATLKLLSKEKAKLEECGLTRVAELIGGVAECLHGEAYIKGDIDYPTNNKDPLSEKATWSWQEREVFMLVNAHRLNAQGNTNKAIKYLLNAHKLALSDDLGRSAFRFKLLIFLLQHRTDDRVAAQKLLVELIRTGTRLGILQILVDLVEPYLESYRGYLLQDGCFSEPEAKFLSKITRKSSKPNIQASAQLSLREAEVLSALVGGGSDKELARKLGLSAHGVRYHLKNIFRKLQVHDRLSAVSTARRIGLVDSD